MKKRLLVIVLATLGMIGAHGAASADQGAEGERRDWACIFLTDLEQGVCQRNPLPERLPVPDDAATTPEAPEGPEVPDVAVPGVSAPTAPTAPTL